MSETVERFRNYYGMSNTIRNLYENGGKRHNNLFRLVVKENNIKLAMKKLSLNAGKNTSGPDGVTFDDVKTMDFNIVKNEVMRRLHLKKKPSGRIVKTLDNNGKMRIIEIIDIFDRLAQQCILNILEPICESIFKVSSFGFRPNLRPQHCIATFNNSLWACVHQGYEYTVITGDFKKCFSKIKLDRVIDTLRNEFNIYDKKFLACVKGLMSINHGKVRYDGNGLSQGSVLGPILCNCILHLLDVRMATLSTDNYLYKKIVKQGRRDYNNMEYENFRDKYEDCYMIRYVRYADDFIIGCTYKEDAPILLKFLETFIEKEIGMELNPSKINIKTLSKFGSESINFLGYKIKTTNGHIRISPDNYSIVCSTIRKGVRKILYKMRMRRERNIYELNSFLSGYINYYDICTNLEPLITYCNNLLYRRGYINFKVLEKEKFRDVYISKREVLGRRSTIDLYGLRELTNKSYKDYIKVPYWKPRSENEFEWVNQIVNYKESFKNIYLHGLLSRYPKDYVTDTDFRSVLHIDIHHKLPVSLGGDDSFNNLIPLSSYSHKLVHCKRENIKKYYKPNIKLSLIKLNKLRKMAKNEIINANDLK